MEQPSAPHEKPPPYSPESTPYSAGPPPYQQCVYPQYPPQAHIPNANVGPSVVNSSVYPPTYGSTNATITRHEIIIVGGCPVCRVGVLEDEYTCAGVLCAILFFPWGILCCLALKEKRCSNCGVHIG